MSDLRSLVAFIKTEPCAVLPPARGWRDYALVAFLWCTAAIEGLVRTDIPMPGLTIPIVMALTLTLLWRRTHPLQMALIVIGAVMVIDSTSVLNGGSPVEVYTLAFMLILFYAIGRWAIGRHIILGALAIIALWAFVGITNFTGVGDLIGSLLVISAPMEIGLAVRYQRTARAQLIEQAKVQEREMLARELHDTVAHRVSAIAVQAQAGQIIARTGGSPGTVDKALATIEEEASRTLAEMRMMVGTLRDEHGDLAMAPQQGATDIPALSSSTIGSDLTVEVDMQGEFDDLDPVTSAALYRIAQESVTNAARHATAATRVEIVVVEHESDVEITITDDGEPPKTTTPRGFGLTGMAERAERLNGRFSAGPNGRGWRVNASLPHTPDTPLLNS